MRPGGDQDHSASNVRSPSAVSATTRSGTVQPAATLHHRDVSRRHPLDDVVGLLGGQVEHPAVDRRQVDPDHRLGVAASSPPNRSPSSSDSRTSVITSAVAIRVFDGTQSVSTADPPRPSVSTRVTSPPELAGHQRRLVPAGSSTDDDYTGHGAHSSTCQNGVGPDSLTACCTRRTGAISTRSRWHVRCPHSPLRGTGWLTGWRLTFGGDGWDGALPTLAEDADSQVFVALYDVTEADEEALDRWESADSGLYRKVRVRVSTLEGELTAWVYVLNDFEGGIPSALTVGILADAAEAAGAPGDYVAELRSRPCCQRLVSPSVHQVAGAGCRPARTRHDGWPAEAAPPSAERFGVDRARPRLRAGLRLVGGRRRPGRADRRVPAGRAARVRRTDGAPGTAARSAWSGPPAGKIAAIFTGRTHFYEGRGVAAGGARRPDRRPPRAPRPSC